MWMIDRRDSAIIASMKKWFIVVFLLLPSPLFAHAEEPSAEQFLGALSITKANFGLVSNAFEGMVCEEAFVGGDSWKLAALGENEWVVIGENNIQRTTDGCEFEPIKDTTDLIIPGLEASPDRTTVAYIANAGLEEGIWFSTDRGVTFDRLNIDTTAFQLTALRFVDDTTLIVSGYEPDQDGDGFLLQIDITNGTSQNLTIPVGIKFPYVLDANPMGIVWLGRAETLTVYWGDLADTSVRSYIPRTWPTAATLTADGQTVWVSGVENGQGIARGDMTNTWDVILAEQVASCISEYDGAIYFCGLERRDGADVFQIVDDTTIEPVVRFTDLRGSRSDCPPESDVGTVCPLVWNEVASYFGQEPNVTPDMGTGAPDVGSTTNDSGSISDASDETPPSSGDKGCCATATPTPTWQYGFLFACVVLARSRRRKR